MSKGVGDWIFLSGGRGWSKKLATGISSRGRGLVNETFSSAGKICDSRHSKLCDVERFISRFNYERGTN